jgi:hypothetical protein
LQNAKKGLGSLPRGKISGLVSFLQNYEWGEEFLKGNFHEKTLHSDFSLSYFIWESCFHSE